MTKAERDAVPPVLVEVLRGDAVESRHRGSFAVVDAAGRVVSSAGIIEAPAFPRSAVKPLQALPLIVCQMPECQEETPASAAGARPSA